MCTALVSAPDESSELQDCSRLVPDESSELLDCSRLGTGTSEYSRDDAGYEGGHQQEPQQEASSALAAGHALAQ